MKNPLVFGFILSLMLLCACNSGRKMRDNPLIGEWSGQFGLPPFGKIVYKDYEPAIEYAAKLHMAEIDDIVKNDDEPSFENVILPLDSSGRRLRLVWDLFALAGSVNAGGEMDSLKIRMSAVMSAHADGIYHNASLFDKVKAVYDRRALSGMDTLQVRLTEKTYRLFVRGGAALKAGDKASLGKINGELARLEVLYGNNLLDSRNATTTVADSSHIDGLSFEIRNYASQLAGDAEMPGKFIFTDEEPVIAAILMTAKNRELREKIYKAAERTGAGDSLYGNSAVLWDIVRLRNEKAKLLGYGTYAAYCMPGTMAGDIGAVYDVLDMIWGAALGRTQIELNAAEQVRPSGNEAPIRKWDWDFYLAQARRRESTVDQDQIEPYLSLVGVRLGAFDLCNRLFGLTFRPIQPELYDSDCEAYEVFDIDNTHLGVMIFDYYTRQGKKSGAWTQRVRPRWPYGGDYSDPVTCSVFNFMRSGSAGRPTLLSFADVEEVFRQVGNAVEILFEDAPYAGLQRLEPGLEGVTGQMLSYWTFEPSVMFNYAVNHSSGRQLTDINMERVYKSRNYRRGYELTRITASSYLDMDVHMNMAADTLFGDVEKFERQQLNVKRGLSDNIGPFYQLTDFGQAFAVHDGVDYYGELWTSMVGADIFTIFKHNGNLFDRQISRRLRDDVLAKGASAPADVLYRNFRGRGVSMDGFLVYNGLVDEAYFGSDSGDNQPDDTPILPVDTLPAPVPALELWKPNRVQNTSGSGQHDAANDGELDAPPSVSSAN